MESRCRSWRSVAGARERIVAHERDVRERLRQAVDDSEVVRVVYHGGSQPGSVREISPVHVGTSELAARDSTGTMKTFKIARIELAEEATAAPEYVPRSSDDPPLPTIAEALEGKRASLGKLGWHVVITEEQASLRDYFKNGKPKKTADVTLSRREVWVKEVRDRETGAVQEWIRKSVLPYRVESRLAPGWAFDESDEAATVFLDEARSLAPASGDAREAVLEDRRRVPFSWRDEPPTERQLDYADQLRIEVPDGATKGDVSDLIDFVERGDSEASASAQLEAGARRRRRVAGGRDQTARAEPRSGCLGAVAIVIAVVLWLAL